jgi:ABC-type glutathione transport system ATPase component
LLLQPPILILDDPTASVDARTENEIVSALREAMAGRTTFVVSSRLSLLRRADLILVLEDGRLTQTGTHEELVHRPGPYHETALLQIMDLDEGRLRVEVGNASEDQKPESPAAPRETFRRGRRSPITIRWRSARRTRRRCNGAHPPDFPLHQTLRGQAELAVRSDVHARPATAGAGVADWPHHQRADFGPHLPGIYWYAAGISRWRCSRW